MSFALAVSAAHALRRLLTDPQYFQSLACLVIVGDALLTQLIIRFVPYTEIDWETYMYHITLYLKGERNYSNISGPTGPLVYPAGHVYIHQLLYNVTQSGEDLLSAQQIYAVFAGTVPNWVLLLLPLSKRLHSIFVLRLFNDCWAVVLTQLSILAYVRGLDSIATLLFSAALSVKMSVFLYLPGILVVLFRRRGLVKTLRLLLAMASVQAVLALPFLREHPGPYLKNAFDLSRIFLYKWTVNWRFFSEDTFLNPVFARTLLLAHLSVLIIFGLTRWCQKDGGVLAVLLRGLRRPQQPPSLSPLLADETITILFTSNLIGILFARSLHYQFYSWYAWQVPFLAWKTRYPNLVKYAF
ncbi:hypothetical protein EWM64_g7049 [Hericium alpestre]|uniref:Dol-P-Man:Man(5)GlcNAc(2)-PP-Dol alpha-1,3-mannosyltransferase n=1 Tax=Hericium alpestre TaxID=135208 RepID=A0A4Y9ZQV7_9AGAM|nr:hypothetical protein EWM64_g7049 [Hericium alpestre]